MIKTLFPQLSSLVIDEVVGEDRVLRVRARTSTAAVSCPQCKQPADRVHAYHLRRLADLPVGGRGVVIDLRVRRLVCSTKSCPRRTFREQMPALTSRWARRTVELTGLIGDLAVVVAGRAGSAVLARLGTRVSRSTVLRVLMAMPKRGQVLLVAPAEEDPEVGVGVEAVWPR